MKKALVILLLISSCANASTCIVEKIPDGDTITCSGNVIRFAHIDTPECGQQGGQMAKDHLSSIIQIGDEVNVDLDKKGRYGRYISVVYKDGLNVNLQMVLDGYAYHYKKYSDDMTYSWAETSAASDNKGIHTLNIQMPWDYRHTVSWSIRKDQHCE